MRLLLLCAFIGGSLGCISNSHKFNIGEMWTEQKFIAKQCTKKGDREVVEILGCYEDRTTIPINSNRIIKGVKYACRSLSDGKMVLYKRMGQRFFPVKSGQPKKACCDVDWKHYKKREEWIEGGMFKMRCGDDGKKEPVGCVSNGVEMLVNGAAVERVSGGGTFLWRCLRASGKDIKLCAYTNIRDLDTVEDEPVPSEVSGTCRDHLGKEHHHGETWSQEKLAVSCLKGPDGKLGHVVTGCMKGDIVVPINDERNISNVTWVCVIRPRGIIQLGIKGQPLPQLESTPTCEDVNGGRHSAGERWVDGTFKKICASQNGTVSPETIGCLKDPQSMTLDGQAAIENEEWLCKTVSPSGEVQLSTIKGPSTSTEPGCHDTNGVKREEGDEWVDGSFKMRCFKNSEGGDEPKIVACVLREQEIPVNYQKQIDDQNWHCLASPHGTTTLLTTDTPPKGEASQLEAQPSPLSRCYDLSGEEHAYGDEWETESYKLRCESNNNGGNQAVVTACIKGDVEIPVNSTAQIGDRLYECKLLPNGSATVGPVRNKPDEVAPAPGTICVDSTGRNHSEGEEWEEETYKVKCIRDEQGELHLVPTACIVDETEIPVNSTAQIGDRLYECKLLPNGSATVEPVNKPDEVAPAPGPTCVDSMGRNHSEGEEWEEETYKVKCIRDEQGELHLVPTACIVDEREIPVNSTAQIGDRLYECKLLPNGSATVGPVRNKPDEVAPAPGPICVDSTGRNHSEGEEWEEETYKVKCIRDEQGELHLVPTACIVDETEIPIGGEGVIDGEEWECQLQSNNSVVLEPKLGPSAIFAPSECMDSLENEFQLEEEWVDGAYKKKCVMDDDGELHAKVLYCIKYGVMIPVGTRKYIDDELWACKRLSEYNASLEIQSEQEETVPSAKSGQLCTDSSGIQHQENEEWVEGDVQMTCAPTYDGTLHPQPSACIKDDIKIPLGGVLMKGDSVWKCNPHPSVQLPKLIKSELTDEPPANGDDLPPLLSPSKCIVDYGEAGKVYHFEKKWIDEPYKFKCVHDKIHYIRPLIIGCVKDGDVIAVGGEKHIDGIVWKCARLSDNSVELLPKTHPKTPEINKSPSSCTDSLGRAHSEGDEWTDETFIMKCIRDEDGNLRPKGTYCLRNDIKIPVNGMMTTPKEETAWKCEAGTPGAKLRLVPVPTTEVPKINDTSLAEDARLSKCIRAYRNGVKIFNIGKEWTDGQFKYKCTVDDDHHLRPVVVACVKGGKEVSVGATVEIDGEEFHCETLPYTTTTPIPKNPIQPPGVPEKSTCVDIDGVKHEPGEEWILRGYKKRCVVDPEGNQSQSVVTACVENTIEVPVGGVMVKGNEEWHCAKQPTGGITLEQKPLTPGEEPLKPPRNTTSRLCFTDYGNDGVKVFSFNRVWIEDGIKWTCVHHPENTIMKKAMGCVKDGVEIPVDGEAQIGDTHWQCRRLRDGKAGLRPIIDNIPMPETCFDMYGDEHKDGEEWNSPSYRWVCTPNEDADLEPSVRACLTDGTAIPVGAEVEKNGNVWECKPSGDTPELVETKPPIPPPSSSAEDKPGPLRPTQCVTVHPNGAKVYNFGSEWIDGSLKYKCVRSEMHHILPEIVGCVKDFAEIPVGDEKRIGDKVWQCISQPDGTATLTPKNKVESPPLRHPVASEPHHTCTDSLGKQHEKGEEWTEGEFKIQCVDDESGTPHRVLTACTKDEVEIPVGEEVSVNGKMWQCTGQPDGTAVITAKARLEHPPKRAYRDKLPRMYYSPSAPGRLCTDSNGATREEGEEWTEGTFEIQCVEDESGVLRREVTACIKDEVEIPVGGEKGIGDKVWQCRGQPDGTAVLTAKEGQEHPPKRAYREKLSRMHSPSATGRLCTDSNGATREEGEEWTEGAFKAKCVIGVNGRHHREIVACIKDKIEVPVGGVMVNDNAEWYCAKQPNGTVTFRQKPMASGEEPLKAPTYRDSYICVTAYGDGVMVFNFNKEWIEGGVKWKCVHDRRKIILPKALACIKDGVEILLGNEAQIGNAKWECKRLPNGKAGIRPMPGGLRLSGTCTDYYGIDMQDGEEWNKGGYRIECRPDEHGNMEERAIGCWKKSVVIPLGAEMEMNGNLWECRESGNKADLISKPPIPPSTSNHKDKMALIRQSQCVIVYPNGAKVFRFGRVWIDGSFKFKCGRDDVYHILPKVLACVKSSEEIPAGSEKHINGKVWQCISQPDGTATLAPKYMAEARRRRIPGGPLRGPSVNSSLPSPVVSGPNCKDSKGRLHEEGEEWIDGSFKKRCVTGENGRHAQVVACIKGKREIPLDGTMQKDNKMWYCNRLPGENAELTLKPSEDQKPQTTCNDSSGNTHKMGDEWIEGNLKMLCLPIDTKRSAPSIIACVKDGEDIVVGEEEIINGRRYECAELPNGKAELRTKEWIRTPALKRNQQPCLPDGCCDASGNGHKLGEEWNDGAYSMVCTRGPTGTVLAKVRGCVRDGVEIPINEKRKIGGYVWTCAMDEYDMVRMSVTARRDGPQSHTSCTDSYGKEHNEGESWVEQNFRVVCVQEGAIYIPRIIACVQEIQKIPLGAAKVVNNRLWHCDSRHDGYVEMWSVMTLYTYNSDAQYESRTCLDSLGKFYNVGDRWVDGMFRMSCVDNEHGGSTMQVVGCVKDNIDIAFNTEKTIGGMRWKCNDLGDGSYQLMTVNEDIHSFPKVCHDEMGKVHQNGEEWVEKGMFRMKCSVYDDGSFSVDVVACITGGTSLEVGKRRKLGGVEWMCRRNKNGFVELVQASAGGSRMFSICVDGNNKRRRPGEVWIERGMFRIECKGDRTNGYNSEITACLKDGHEIPVGGKDTIGGITYYCTKKNDGGVSFTTKPQGGSSLRDIPCQYDGKTYKPGAEWTTGKFKMRCNSNDRMSIAEAIGCIVDGQEIALNTTKRIGMYVYNCTKTGSGSLSLTSEVADEIPCGNHSYGSVYWNGNFKLKCAKKGSVVLLACRVGTVEIPANHVKYVKEYGSRYKCVNDKGVLRVSPVKGRHSRAKSATKII